MADYRRQSKKTTGQPEEDPSIFATALETLAVKAFGDMGHTARLRIIQDRFIAGHASCELCKHLDSVAPETHIRDIVDHCRVWESHADSDNRRGSRPGPERALPIYMVDDVGSGTDDRTVAAVTTSPTAPEQFKSLLRRLLPTPVVPPPRPKMVPSELDQLLQRLLGGGGGGHGSLPHQDWNHCNRNFAAKFASCESVPGFSDTAGPRTSGLDYGAVFLVWQDRLLCYLLNFIDDITQYVLIMYGINKVI